MAVVWEVRDEAGRVLRERQAFRIELTRIAQPPSDVDAAELIYGELVANTVRHARGAVEVRLEHSDSERAVLVVRDHGPGLKAGPPAPRRDPLAESGRGLAIVEMLAFSVAVEGAEGGGTIVRATLPITARTEPG
ncbi:MAG: putative anti-sigma regulatory factor, serine/threonine protein kinase [Candidatus Eremiobacteraeota bacterium]|nr:putative anti-sigma regulatory factor, serine/threonine protein kinase [Candidatus Eremiobacteraeota bacterium]